MKQTQPLPVAGSAATDPGEESERIGRIVEAAISPQVPDEIRKRLVAAVRAVIEEA